MELDGNNKCDFLIGHLPPLPKPHAPRHIKQYCTTIPQTNILDLLSNIAPIKVLQGTKAKPMSYTHIEVFVIRNVE